MRNESKTAFRPSLERFEGRIVATAGVVAAAAHHAAPHPPAHVEPHHASPPPKHPAPKHAEPKHTAAHPAPTQPASTGTTSPAVSSTPQPTVPPPPSSPSATNTASNQAWVEIQNTTGETLEYYIKLAPYDNGQFIPFDIAPGQTQYQYSSLIVDGQRVKADFAIQFGNGPITPLMTGTSEATAQGYDIFLDGNLEPYVYPFTHS
jgi:hypothetical protein